LKLEYDKLLSNCAFNSNMRHYTKEKAEREAQQQKAAAAQAASGGALQAAVESKVETKPYNLSFKR